MAESVNEDVDDIYAQNIFVLEKELGAAAQTHEESLLLKFFSQLEYLGKLNEEEKKQMNKHKNSRRTLG